MNRADRKSRREALKEQRRAEKQARQELRRCQQREGLEFPAAHSRSNRVSEFKTVEEETEARLDATVNQARIIRSKLPLLLARLTRIEDPRNPKKLKHRITVMLIYGILMFVYQASSRREANQE